MSRDIFFKTDDFVFSYRVGGLLVRNGKVLLQKHREKEEYYIIGGHIVSLETAEDALKREFKEELGASETVGKRFRTISATADTYHFGREKGNISLCIS